MVTHPRPGTGDILWKANALTFQVKSTYEMLMTI